MYRIIKYIVEEAVIVENSTGVVKSLSKSDFISFYNKNRDKFYNVVVTKGGVIKRKGSDKFEVEHIVKFSLDKYRNNKIYDGNNDKFGITVKGKDYIVKLAKYNGDMSVVTEHVASRFIKQLGIECHVTKLCRYKNEVCVVIEDFTSRNSKLISYKDTRQSSEGTDISSKGYTYNDVIDMINKHTKLTRKNKENEIKHFWTMFLLDAILANRDRHPGNWGYLVDKDIYKPAPIYDNGWSLFPDVKAVIHKYKNDRIKFIKERSEYFPASLLKTESKDGAKRTNYFDIIPYLAKTYNEFSVEYNKLLNVKDEIIYSAIVNAVCEEVIPKEIRSFYIDVVMVRFLHIIKRLTLDDAIKRVNEMRCGRLC